MWQLSYVYINFWPNRETTTATPTPVEKETVTSSIKESPVKEKETNGTSETPEKAENGTKNGTTPKENGSDNGEEAKEETEGLFDLVIFFIVTS